MLRIFYRCRIDEQFEREGKTKNDQRIFRFQKGKNNRTFLDRNYLRSQRTRISEISYLPSGMERDIRSSGDLYGDHPSQLLEESNEQKNDLLWGIEILEQKNYWKKKCIRKI